MGIFDKLFGKKETQAAQPVVVPAKEPAAVETGDTPKPETPPEVRAAEVREMLAGGNPPILLDVREQHELNATGWLPDAIHIPMNDVPKRIGELDNDRPIVVYCASGIRSFDVGFYLIGNGFRNVSNLSGGIKAWDGEIERA